MSGNMELSFQFQIRSHSFARLSTQDSKLTHNKSFCGMWTNRSFHHGQPNTSNFLRLIGCSRTTDEEEEKRAQNWITAITEGTSECTVPDDYGLHSMPSILDQPNSSRDALLSAEDKWAIFLAL
jgi:hypothetical protein